MRAESMAEGVLPKSARIRLPRATERARWPLPAPPVTIPTSSPTKQELLSTIQERAGPVVRPNPQLVRAPVSPLPPPRALSMGMTKCACQSAVCQEPGPGMLV